MRRRRFDKLLVLDLDETLIHSTESPLSRTPDFTVDPYFVYTRPHLDTFVRTCLAWFETGVWTSATEDYARQVVARIFPDPSVLSFVRSSDAQKTTTQAVKNLSELEKKGYPLEKIVVVDDSPLKHIYHQGNLVCVKEYRGDPADRELPRLTRFLEILGDAPDVRSVDKRFWRDQVQKKP